MAEEPTGLRPPDPTDRQGSTSFLPAPKRRSSQKTLRTSTPSASPLAPPSSSQPTARPLTSELAAYAAGKARKRQATAGPEDRPSLPDLEFLGTPRSIRLKNLFTGAMAPPNMLDVATKLNDLVESSIKLTKKGAEKISVGSETAANIKTLVVRLLELAEFHHDIPAIRRNPFSTEDDEHQVERALAGANTFGCKVPEVIEAKLDQLTKSIESLERAVTAPSSNFNFRPAKSTATTPSYALAASKHAPPTSTAPRQAVFKPTSVRMKPPTPPPAFKTLKTLTLAQTCKDGKVLASMNCPTLIAKINTTLAEVGIKETPSDDKAIRIRSVHRHPSNDLVIYTTTTNQATALRDQHEKWVHLIDEGLVIHNPVHTVVVHGIPTSFNPTDPQHIEMLTAMNTDTLNPPPTFIKWLSENAVQRGASHSSIHIGFADAGQAQLAVDHKIFYGRFNKQTEHGRKTKPRCMNCLRDGHVTKFCKDKLMCPYCSGDHAADSCELHGRMNTNCTACARHAQKENPSIDLVSLFSETPRYLRHSPLDPTCPARLAEKKARVQCYPGARHSSTNVYHANRQVNPHRYCRRRRTKLGR